MFNLRGKKRPPSSALCCCDHISLCGTTLPIMHDIAQSSGYFDIGLLCKRFSQHSSKSKKDVKHLKNTIRRVLAITCTSGLCSAHSTTLETRRMWSCKMSLDHL